MKSYKVVTEFSVLDRATNQLNKMASQGNVAAGVLGRGINQAQTRVSALGATMSSALSMGVKVGVGAIAAGLAVATRQFAQYDEAIRSAAAAYGPAFTQAENFENKLKDMGRAVRNVAAATEFDALQAGTAMKTLAQAGVQSEQAIALLPGVADLATTALTGMDEAVGLAVGSLNVMGMMTDKPEELAKNMTRISDVMAYTANSAYMSLQDVGAAISAGGSFFRSASDDLNVMSGLLTALANNSIKGAEAETHLKNIMTDLSAPTSRAAAALKKMNITTTDAAGNLLPLPKIIGQLNKAMAGMGDTEKNANIYDIFGKQNIVAVTALLNTGEEALNSYAMTASNDLNVMSGLLTALANNSIKGAEAGTHLRNIMTNLSAPTSRAAAALKKMNITTTDAAGNLLPLPKIIGQFNKAMAGMGDAEKNANIYDIFGKQNIAAVTALLNTGEEALNSYALAAANSAGTAAKGAEVIRGGLINQLKVLVSGLTELGFKFVEAFETRGSSGLKKLTEAVNNFDPQPLINAALKIVDTFSQMVMTAWKFRGVILAIVGAMVAWRASMTAIVVGMKLMQAFNVVMAFGKGIMIAYKAAAVGTTVAIKAQGAASIAAAAGMKVAAAAQLIWNAAMAANPIGLVIAGVVALVGIIVVLVGKWQKVSEAVDGFFAKIRGMKGFGGMILQQLAAPLELVWGIIRGLFDTINAFKVGGFIAGIKMLGLSILQMIASPIQAILESISWIPGMEWLHNKISGFFDNARNSILAGSGATDSAGGLPAESEADAAASMAEPTRSAAVANSYSREESVTTNRVEIGLSDGLTVKNGATAAPAFTLQTGRR